MSFEGFYQLLCKNGHYWEEDIWGVFGETTFNKCPKCKKSAVWSNIVDVTNGSYDENEKRIDGFVELELLKLEICSKCKQVIEEKFKIPKGKIKKNWRK